MDWLEMHSNEYPPAWLLDDVTLPDGQVIDARQYTDGTRAKDVDDLRVVLNEEGEEQPLTCGPDGCWIARRDVKEAIESLTQDSVEWIPVRIRNHAGPFYLMNVISVVDAIDEPRCEGVWRWKPGDAGLPRKYFGIWKVRIDPRRAAGLHVFRLEHWKVTLVVSSRVRELLDTLDCRAAQFTSVT